MRTYLPLISITRPIPSAPGRVQEDPTFLEQVAEVVPSCREVLILGPRNEKTALLHHLQFAYPQIVLRLEACDHPTDPEIIALGRKHFGLDSGRE
jgi:hypothetical protein